MSNQNSQQIMQNKNPTAIRSRLKIQTPPVDKTGLQSSERIIPVGTGRFIQNVF